MILRGIRIKKAMILSRSLVGQETTPFSWTHSVPYHVHMSLHK
jgi:hypothetical protein